MQKTLDFVREVEEFIFSNESIYRMIMIVNDKFEQEILANYLVANDYCVFSIDKYYAVTSVILDLKEYKFYTLKIYDTDNLVYKGMIFCTNQTVKDYTINKDVYTQNESNNDYIIFD